MSQPPSSSSSSKRPPTSIQMPSSSTTPPKRLPSFRDLNNPIQQVFLNKTKAFNKKTYVPNLFLSRNIQNKVNEESVPSTSSRKEPERRDNRRGRREPPKLLPAAETFVPPTGMSRSSQSTKSRSKTTSATVVVKQESIDRSVMKKICNKQLPTRFEKMSSASTHDLPVPIPKSSPTATSGNSTKINPLLTDILRVDGEESPLFLLKTPRYIPAVLDDSKNQPKLGSKDEKSGYKCSLRDLPEGQIGKIQILKSGKLKLVLGDCKFWLLKGVNVDCREELAVIKTDSESRSGDIISLGAIKGRITVVPDVVSRTNS